MDAIKQCNRSVVIPKTLFCTIFVLLIVQFATETTSFANKVSTCKQLMKAPNVNTHTSFTSSRISPSKRQIFTGASCTMSADNKEEEEIRQSMYELKEIAGKGFGAIALRDITPGELIMEEKPLFSITTKKGWFTPSESYSETRIENEVEKLSDFDQKRFYSLHGFVGHDYEIGTTNTDDIVSSEINQIEAGEPITLRSKKLKMEIPPIHIYRTNAYPMGPGKSGIFPVISRLNSHCTPNVHYNYNDKSGKSTIYCVSKILKGDEIVNCYIGLYIPRIERMKYLWGNFGFPCSCNTCSLTGTEQIDSDYRRTRLEGLEELCVTAILEKKKNLALDLINTRLNVLREEGLDNSATLYKCEYDAFLSFTCNTSSTAALVDDISGSADCTSSRDSNGDMLDLTLLDLSDRIEAKHWLELAYNHVVQAKGSESKESQKCFYYLSILNLL